MESLDQRQIEHRWQERWAQESAARPSPLEVPVEDDERRFYCLDMFPYPSASGLSVNQVRGMLVTDVVARFEEARGRQVLRPMGWDAFGLSIEREARRRQIDPREVVAEGIAVMKDQLRRMGMRIDWQCELNSSDPQYYRWTQWLFLKLHERGLTYRAETSIRRGSFAPMNLPAEEGEGAEIAKPHWVVRITDYGERLHQGLRDLEWPPRVKALQRNWIGRRAGFRLLLKANNDMLGDYDELPVFVRRLEFIPAGTFLVLAPEHPLVDRIADPLHLEDIAAYRERVCGLSERERLMARGVADGCPTGAMTINPITLRRMPIWISGFVLPNVRYGAVYGVPSHEPQHAAFAQAHDLPSREERLERRARRRDRRRGRGPMDGADALVLTGVGNLSGVPLPEARRRIRALLEKRGLLEATIDFHLRDWVFGRQHYWGEPIPVEYDAAGEPRLVDESALPIELPHTREIPDERAGRAPLAQVESFVRVATDDLDAPPRTRETDIMPQWIASCWYYLRFLDPTAGAERPFDPDRARRWLPVDLCVGGIEHAVLHLLYVRFFAYFFKDLGFTAGEEPFRRVFNQGRLYHKTPDRERAALPMHRGDRIEVAPYLEEFGGDALRLHILFLGPPAEDVVWSARGLAGCRRFLERTRGVVLERMERGRFVSRRVLVEKHQLIRRVTQAIQTFRLNKAVSAFMEFVKFLRRADLTPEEVDRASLRTFCILLGPFAPHLAAELWDRVGGEGSVGSQPWPSYSEELLRPLEVELLIQLEGRSLDRMIVEGHPSDDEIVALARVRPRVREALEGLHPTRWVVVPDRLVNIVLRRPAPAAVPPTPAPVDVSVPAGNAAATPSELARSAPGTPPDRPSLRRVRRPPAELPVVPRESAAPRESAGAAPSRAEPGPRTGPPTGPRTGPPTGPPTGPSLGPPELSDRSEVPDEGAADEGGP